MSSIMEISLLSYLTYRVVFDYGRLCGGESRAVLCCAGGVAACLLGVQEVTSSRQYSRHTATLLASLYQAGLKTHCHQTLPSYTGNLIMIVNSSYLKMIKYIPMLRFWSAVSF